MMLSLSLASLLPFVYKSNATAAASVPADFRTAHASQDTTNHHTKDALVVASASSDTKTLFALPNALQAPLGKKPVAQDGPGTDSTAGDLDDTFPLPSYDSTSDGFGRQLDLPEWFDEVRALPVGGVFDFSPTDREEIRTLRALGFERTTPTRFCRMVDLLKDESLVYQQADSLPGIDAITIVSISRGKTVGKEYLYETLQSLFTEFSDEIAVNVFVGSADADYVSQDSLTTVIGESAARRVFPIFTTPEIDAHFAKYKYSVRAKATWNFARAIRNYHGTGSLLVLEDDVQFAKHAAVNLKPWLDNLPTKATMLFQKDAADQDSLWRLPKSNLRMEMRPTRHNYHSSTTQGSLLHHSIAAAAGDYLAFRAGREVYDFMLGRYLSGTTGGIGVSAPSLVQHIGFVTTGLSSPKTLPISHTFEKDLGLPSDERFPGGK